MPRRSPTARLPDPGFPGLQPPVEAPAVDGFDEATGAEGPADQAERAWSAIEAAGDFGLYGYYTSGVTELGVASTTGLSVSQAMTDATVLALAASENCSGYAEATSWKAGEIDPAVVAHEAAEKATRTAGAHDLEPGIYRAVLEPYAFAELLWYFAYSSLGALALLEGRSFLSGRIGETLFHPTFSLYDDGGDRRGLPKAFDFEGVPKQRVPIVEERSCEGRRLGPAYGGAGWSRVDRPRASCAGPVLRSSPLQPLRARR